MPRTTVAPALLFCPRIRRIGQILASHSYQAMLSAALSMSGLPPEAPLPHALSVKLSRISVSQDGNTPSPTIDFKESR